MNLEELRLDCAIKQKKGLHFILASVVIWCAVLVVQLIDIPSLMRIAYFGCLLPVFES